MVKAVEHVKTLFITHAYPPMHYPRSVQIGHLVSYLRNQMDLKVLSSRFGSNIDSSYQKYLSLDNVIYPEKTTLTTFFERWGGYRLKTTFFQDVSIPESRELRIASQKLFGLERFHSIVTFGQPMSVHNVGLKLKRQNPNVQWIAHFSDPWIDNPYSSSWNAWVRYLNHQSQYRVFNKADKLVFTSSETLALVMLNCSEEIRKKAIVIPHCFNPKLYPSHQSHQSGSLVVRYLGNFYGGRQPGSFFKALSILKKKGLLPPLLKVELIGADLSYRDSIIKNNIEDFVTVLPSIPYLDSLKLMSESDMLLVIDAPFENSPFLPSKLIDYIGANKPIFGITPQGTSQKLIEEMGFCVAHPNNPLEISEKFLKMLKLVEGIKQVQIESAVRNRFELPVVGNQFYELLAPEHET